MQDTSLFLLVLQLLTCGVDRHHHNGDGKEEGPQLNGDPRPCPLQEPCEASHQWGHQHQPQQQALDCVHEEQGLGLLVETVALLNDNFSPRAGEQCCEMAVAPTTLGQTRQRGAPEQRVYTFLQRLPPGIAFWINS